MSTAGAGAMGLGGFKFNQLAVAAVLFLSACGASSSFSIASSEALSEAQGGAADARQVIVKLSTNGGLTDPGSAIGARSLKSLPQLNLSVLSVPAGMSSQQALGRLSGIEGIEYAQLDYRLKATLTPNNPEVSKQWGLKSIDAFGAWDFTVGRPDVVVAVVDTGVDLTHPQLSERLVSGKSFVASKAGSGPADDNGHGTHVAGIIAANINSGIGTVGVAPGCKIMPIKVLDSGGDGNTSDIVAGLIFAADHGAKIINLSLGGNGGGNALAEAVRYAQGKGCLVVAAMGNDGINRQEYPAAYSGVVGVGATSEDDSIAAFSNYGNWISVSAPGDGIYSTMPTYQTRLTASAGAGLGYGYLSGTSMATPFVSGVAALVASAHPGLSGSAIKNILETTTTDLGVPGFDTFFGHGKVNARRAVTAQE